MKVDLARAQRLAESLLNDACAVTRGAPLTVADEDFNDATGEYTTPTGATETVYTGPCSVVVRQEQASTAAGVTAPLPAGLYRLLLPLSAPVLAPDDLVVVTAASQDPRLLTRQFRVTDAGDVGTYAVLRDVGMTEVRVHV